MRSTNAQFDFGTSLEVLTMSFGGCFSPDSYRDQAEKSLLSDSNNNDPDGYRDFIINLETVPGRVNSISTPAEIRKTLQAFYYNTLNNKYEEFLFINAFSFFNSKL